MTVIDIKRRRRILDPTPGDVHRALTRACAELGGEEGMRGYFKMLAKEHPDLFMKLLLAALAK